MSVLHVSLYTIPLGLTLFPDYHQAKRPEEEEASAAVPRLLPSHKVGKKPLLEIRGLNLSEDLPKMHTLP